MFSSRFSRHVLLLSLLSLLGALLWACQGDDEAGSDVGAGSISLDVHPPTGGLGTTLTVSIAATQSAFDFESTSVDFGEGIQVLEVAVQDAWNIDAQIEIDRDAELGTRDVLVDSRGRSRTAEESFTVVEESFTISPDYGMLGASVEVEIVGANTSWEDGVTWPSFGDGIDILSFTVYTPTLAQATLSVAADTYAGMRDVLMESGPDVVVLYDGFQVDRAGVAASFDPAEAEQGDTVVFTVEARGTNFVAGETELFFMRQGEESNDIQVDTLEVLDATNLYGTMTLSNAAVTGFRDVLITTPEEGVMIPDAFEVIDGPWDLSEVAVSIAFYIVRGVDNSSCVVYEDVVAYVWFYIPLDPPCGSGSMSMMDSPQPYDINGVFVYPPASKTAEEDCPIPSSIPAGDYVWFESDVNTVTLDRVEDAGTGQIFYWGYDLTAADYAAGNWYDLHTQGEEGGLGEYLLEEVQPTVPADWELLSPALCQDYTHSRAEDFTYTWTPAQTYPDAFFLTGIPGTLESTGDGCYAGSIPWDDGEHTYTSSELSQLAAEPTSFWATSYIEGPTFGLPDSIYQGTETESYIYLSASLNLE